MLVLCGWTIRLGPLDHVSTPGLFLHSGDTVLSEGWWVSAGAVEELGHSEDTNDVVLDRQFVEAGRHGLVDGQ